ncbi:MAG: hypothetical protein J0L99_14685 [Chitinophagales bacterium]|nr:hypothetical protein [Chitinophagales bacterium]
MNTIPVATKYLLLFLCVFYTARAQAQLNWTAFPGPEGGSSHYLISDNGDYAFYPSPYALYRSADGENWSALPMSNLRAMALNGPQIAGLQSNAYGKPLLWFSADHGDNWLQGLFPFEHSGVFVDIALSDDGIFIPHKTEGLIFRSPDGGLQWDTLLPPATIKTNFNLFSSRNRVYAAQGKFLFRLSAGAQGWDSIPLPANFFGVSAVFEDPDVMVVGSSSGELWSSRDGGQSWTRFYEDSHYTGAIVRLNNRLYACNQSQIFVSSDLGLSWSALSLPVWTEFSVIAVVADRLLFKTWETGVLQYNPDSGQIKSANSGLLSARVREIDISGNEIWAACPDGLYRADLQNKQWTFSAERRPFSMVKANGSGGVAALTAFRDTLYISQNGGASWQKTAIRAITGSSNWESYSSISWAGSNLFLHSSVGALRSSDGGQSWQNSANIVDVVFFKGNWYANNGTQLMKSADGGGSWQPLAPPGAILYSLSAAGDYLCVWFVDAMYRSTLRYSEDGEHWVYADEGLHDIPFGDSQFEFYLDNGGVWEHNGVYYAQHPLTYLYISTDTMKHWHPLARVPQQMLIRDSLMYTSAPYEGGGVGVAQVPVLYDVFSQGTVYLDENNNGVFDSNELPLSGMTVAMKSPNSNAPYWTGSSDGFGRYAVLGSSGQADTLALQLNFGYPALVNPPFYLVSNTTAPRDFGVYFPAIVEDLAAFGAYFSRPVPGFPINISLQVKNLGTRSGGGQLGVKLSPDFQFSGASVAPAQVFADSLVWDIAALKVFGIEYLKLSGTLQAAATLGEPFETGIRILVAGSDADLSNNYYLLRDTIVGAYDPNEKRVHPAAGLSAAEIEAGVPLEYTIHFQNVGSFPATRVRITDQLDPELAPESLQLLGASHPVSAFRLLPGGNLEIIFEDIVLPDSSSDAAGSQGFVQFSIQRKKVFDPYYFIRNTANIYFDFNAPIQTNTVWTPLRKVATGLNDARSENRLQALHLSPNPSEALVQISAEGLSGQGRVQVADFYGKIWLELPVLELDKPFVLDLSALPAGAYGVQLFNARHRRQGKLILIR